MKKILLLPITLAINSFANCTAEDIKFMSKSGYQKEEIQKLCSGNTNTQTAVEVENTQAVTYSQPSNSGSSVNKQSFYIGFATFNGSGTNTYSSTAGTDFEEDIDASSGLIKFGWFLRRDNRFEISSESITTKYDNGSTDKLSSFNLDWYFTYPSNNLAPYWTIGIGSNRWHDTGQYFVSGEDLVGVSFNYGVGFLYSINENFEIDFGFKGKSIMWQDVEVYSSYGWTTDTVSTDTVISGVNLGLNIKF